MSVPTLLRAADRAAQPWRNGGGSTWTVAAWPDGAGIDDFLWRVSIARVERAGPFSAFADTDRHLTVLDGRLDLTVAGVSRVLSAGGCLSFGADCPAFGVPLGEAVVDLNVMTRRARCIASVRRIADRKLKLAAAHWLVVAAADMTLTIAADVYRLGPLDALWGEGPLSGQAAGRGYLIALR